MNWDIREAQEQFGALISATNQEPQLIYDREKLVVAVVDAQTFQKFLFWQ